MPVIGGGAFPQTGDNRTRADMERDLAAHVGGADEAEVRTEAGRALGDAIRDYNAVLWSFNRVVQDITLAPNTAEYDLLGNVHHFMRAHLLDKNNRERHVVEWIDYPIFLIAYPFQQTGSDPVVRYTARNTHDTGKVTFDPRPVDPVASDFPKVRLYYFRRIALASGDTDKLNVPSEVEGAIFKWALANFLFRQRQFDAAAPVYKLADELKARVERLWRDYPDFTI